MDRQHVAKKHYLPLGRGAGQDRTDDVDGGHHAQRVVVVLVDHDAVEARLGAVLQLFEIHAVEVFGLLGTEVLVGEHQVVITEVSGFVLGIVGVAHFGEKEYFPFHQAPLAPIAN